MGADCARSDKQAKHAIMQITHNRWGLLMKDGGWRVIEWLLEIVWARNFVRYGRLRCVSNMPKDCLVG